MLLFGGRTKAQCIGFLAGVLLAFPFLAVAKYVRPFAIRVTGTGIQADEKEADEEYPEQGVIHDEFTVRS